jgi:hypothetical protein
MRSTTGWPSRPHHLKSQSQSTKDALILQDALVIALKLVGADALVLGLLDTMTCTRSAEH